MTQTGVLVHLAMLSVALNHTLLPDPGTKNKNAVSQYFTAVSQMLCVMYTCVWQVCVKETHTVL